MKIMIEITAKTKVYEGLEIEHQLDDQVWVIWDNRPQSGAVKEVSIRSEKLLGSAELYSISVSYGVKLKGECIIKYFESSQVHKSKMGLLKSLITSNDCPLACFNVQNIL